MKRLLLVIGLFITSYSWSQENLVPNGSFEDLNYCPNQPGNIYSIKNWFLVVPSPDIFNECANGIGPLEYNPGVPNNFLGYAQPVSGVGYCGLALWSKDYIFREYIGIRLSKELKPNTHYFFECYTQVCDSVSYAVKNFGAYFRVDTLLSLNNVQQKDYLLSQEPQIKYVDTAFIEDRDNWIKIKGEFEAGGKNIYSSVILTLMQKQTH